MNIPVEFADITEYFRASLTEENTRFRVELQELVYTQGELRDWYEGAYSAVPGSERQVMETGGLIMKEDFVVQAIPYYSAANPAGGNTVYIGKEVT